MAESINEGDSSHVQSNEQVPYNSDKPRSNMMETIDQNVLKKMARSYTTLVLIPSLVHYMEKIKKEIIIMNKRKRENRKRLENKYVKECVNQGEVICYRKKTLLIIVLLVLQIPLK